MDWPISPDAPVRASASVGGAEDPRRSPGGRPSPGEPLGIMIAENGMRSAKGPRRSNLSRAGPWIGAAAVGLLLSGSAAWFELGQRNLASTTERLPPATAVPLNLPPPDLLRPITPEQAAQENAERPFVVRPDSPAAKFVLRADAENRDRAVNCLTQAVYYEAASEGADGQRAVAQVILNRLHHPGYPSTICGVVYEGAERLTGCQFTFVCDGSLHRAPAAALWARSRRIAEDALAGKVFAAVGHATHYHADYVLPYWADVLDKTVQIGRHIFYRLRGPLGDARGFSQRYGGAEPDLPKPEAATIVLPATAATAALATALASDGTTAAPNVEKAAAPASPLAVDSAASRLIADGDSAVPPHRKARMATDCEGPGGTKLTPLGANDMRSTGDGPGC